MTSKRRKVIILLVSLALVPLIALVILFSVWWRSRIPSFSHVAEHRISDTVVLTAGLVNSHPFLAEYDKYLVVRTDDSVSKFYAGPDPGGFSDIILYEENGSIITITEFEYERCVIDATSGTLSITPFKPNDDLPAVYIGRFGFDDSRTWRFIPAQPGEYRKPW